MNTLMLDPNMPAQPPADDPIADVDLKNFVKQVMEESRRRLVILDVWAPWCGPCKQLVPLLEKLVRSYKGAVFLAKVNIDANPEIAKQLNVQSVPTVFAFSQGKPIDGFMGALPEQHLKSWLDRLVEATGSVPPNGEDYGYGTALGQAADFLAAGDIETAQSIYADILKEAPMNAAAFAGSLRCLLAQGDHALAAEILAQASPELSRDKELDPIRTSIDLALQSAKAGDIAGLEKKVQDNPDNHQARFDLALAHYAAGEREKAVDALLEIVARDRNWQEEAARRQLVKMFEAWGATDLLTIESRKRLSSLLFS